MGGVTHATTLPGRDGLIRPRSLLRAHRDERLVAQLRAGNEHAFEVLFDRYRPRLLAFCRGMLRSSEDAEDVLQEVFTAAHAAILADEREIEVRPWLYRIARNRCLNHMRKQRPECRDTLDDRPDTNGASTEEHAQQREDLRDLVANIRDLPEAQRSALLMRELENLSYKQIAASLETTVPAVKSLLVRARVTLAEASQAGEMTCDEVRFELAAAAEGMNRASGPARHHTRRCPDCTRYRKHLRSTSRGLAALAPVGPILLLKKLPGGQAGVLRRDGRHRRRARGRNLGRRRGRRRGREHRRCRGHGRRSGSGRWRRNRRIQGGRGRGRRRGTERRWSPDCGHTRAAERRTRSSPSRPRWRPVMAPPSARPPRRRRGPRSRTTLPRSRPPPRRPSPSPPGPGSRPPSPAGSRPSNWRA